MEAGWVLRKDFGVRVGFGCQRRDLPVEDEGRVVLVIAQENFEVSGRYIFMLWAGYFGGDWQTGLGKLKQIQNLQGILCLSTLILCTSPATSLTNSLISLGYRIPRSPKYLTTFLQIHSKVPTTSLITQICTFLQEQNKWARSPQILPIFSMSSPNTRSQCSLHTTRQQQRCYIWTPLSWLRSWCRIEGEVGLAEGLRELRMDAAVRWLLCYLDIQHFLWSSDTQLARATSSSRCLTMMSGIDLPSTAIPLIIIFTIIPNSFFYCNNEIILLFSLAITNYRIITVIVYQQVQLMTDLCAPVFRNALELIAKKLNDPALLTPSEIAQLFKPFAEFPYSPDIESLRGLCLQSAQKNQLALYVYDEILVRCPWHAPTLRRKGELLKKMEKERESIELLALAGLLQPDNLHIQILKDNGEQNGDEDDDESQSSEEEKNNIWRIKIKSIDRPFNQIRSAKSVLFKSELEQPAQIQSLNLISPSLCPLLPKKSILKTRSHQQMPVIPNPEQTKSSFDTTKIRSIDGKMSSHSHEDQNKKEIIFSYGEGKGTAAVGSATGLKRKSSLVVSRIGSCKSNLR